MKNAVLNRRLKLLVTVGLGVGYIITVRTSILNGQRASAVGNSILFPTSLVWLWLVSDGES